MGYTKHSHHFADFVLAHAVSVAPDSNRTASHALV